MLASSFLSSFSLSRSRLRLAFTTFIAGLGTEHSGCAPPPLRLHIHAHHTSRFFSSAIPFQVQPPAGRVERRTRKVLVGEAEPMLVRCHLQWRGEVPRTLTLYFQLFSGPSL